MSSKRRYKIGVNPVYDREFNNRRIGSRVINGGNMLPGVNTIIWDKSACVGLLLELRGTDDGYFYRNGIPVKADIPNCLDKLKKLEKDFANHQQSMVNMGQNKPEQWPTDLLNKKFSLEARYDVMYEEVDVIQERLDKFLAREKKELLLKMLSHGPLNHPSLRNNFLVAIDGQKVEQINGRFVITEEESPYYGLSVSDYKEHIAEPWNIVRNTIDNEEYYLTHEMLGRGIKNIQLIKDAWTVKLKELHEQHPEWKSLFALRLENKPPMPEVPKNLKKYL